MASSGVATRPFVTTPGRDPTKTVIDQDQRSSERVPVLIYAADRTAILDHFVIELLAVNRWRKAGWP